MKAAIYLDVPEWQIGQDVSVYFPDTMVQHSKCELLKEQEAVVPLFSNTMRHFVCQNCSLVLNEGRDNYCPSCGRLVKWND